MCWITDSIAPAPRWTLARSRNDHFAGWEVEHAAFGDIGEVDLGLLYADLLSTQEVGCQTPAEWELGSGPTKAERSRAEPRNRASGPGMSPPLTENRVARTC